MFRLIRSTTRVFPRSFLALEALALLAFVLFPGRVAAQTTIATCETISSGGSYTIGSTFTVTTSPCIVVSANNVTITFGSNSSIDVSGYGDAGVAIDTGMATGTIIEGPGSSFTGPANIITAYSSSAASGNAIHSAGTSDITISGLTIWNTADVCAPGTTTTGNGTIGVNQPNQNWGTAISISNATSATITGNMLECYQYGIWVSASAIPSKGTGDISGNTFYNIMHDNSYDSTGASNVLSAAILLDSSSGWSVDGNIVHYSGSRDYKLSCNTSDYGSCSPAIQLTGTSTGNDVTGNITFDNFGPSIYTGPNTAKNRILSNSINPGGTYDLWDAVPPRSTNAWRQNTCPDGALGSVGPQKCP